MQIPDGQNLYALDGQLRPRPSSPSEKMNTNQVPQSSTKISRIPHSKDQFARYVPADFSLLLHSSPQRPDAALSLPSARREMLSNTNHNDTSYINNSR